MSGSYCRSLKKSGGATNWICYALKRRAVPSQITTFVTRPDRRSALTTALWLAAGLLTKAYFLAFALLAVAVTAISIWRGRMGVKTALAGAILLLALAGPWYTRNLVLYKNVSGAYEQFAGIGMRQALAAMNVRVKLGEAPEEP